MLKKTIKVKVTTQDKAKRIDKFLQSQLKDLSRTKIQRLIYEGFVIINNFPIQEASKKVKFGELVEVKIPLPKKTSIVPKKIPLNILHEDQDIILINKSPGIVVHPGAGNYNNTLVNGLLHKYKNNLSNVGGKLRPGIVHRIDKDTSGLIVVAKNDKAHLSLSKQFSFHTIKRKYEALIWGSLKPQAGRIKEKICRSKKNRQLMWVGHEKGKNAITNYKTIEIFHNKNVPKISLVECQLETGRTHQIRVHMAFKGNSILGDKSYGKLRKKFKNINPNLEKEINNFKRQALHAKSLGFIHPRTNQEVFFEVERPKDLDSLIKMLKLSSN